MRAWVLVIGLVLAGCVSLTPVQQARVDEMQAFADRATAAYHVSRVRVSVQSTTNLNIGAAYRQGNIFVSLQMVDSPNWKKTLAHEIGHYLLSHDGFIPGAVSYAEWQSGQARRELDANAKAVEILMRAEGMSQAEAVKIVADSLRRSQRIVDRGAPVTPGHLPPAAELADLLSRFPDSGVTLQSPTSTR